MSGPFNYTLPDYIPNQFNPNQGQWGNQQGPCQPQGFQQGYYNGDFPSNNPNNPCMCQNPNYQGPPPPNHPACISMPIPSMPIPNMAMPNMPMPPAPIQQLSQASQPILFPGPQDYQAMTYNPNYNPNNMNQYPGYYPH